MLEANEASKAAAATWGTGERVPKEEVKRCVAEIQKDFLEKERREGVQPKRLPKEYTDEKEPSETNSSRKSLKDSTKASRNT